VSSDDSDETAIKSFVVTEEVGRVLKSMKCLVEAEYNKEINKILTFDCKCIKHMSPDYIFNIRATMAYVKERDKDLMILMALYRVSGNH
jgi:hypothetical protein